MKRKYNTGGVRRYYLRNWRRAGKYTLREFAGVLGVGINRYGDIERGSRDPDEALLEQIGAALGKSRQEIAESERGFRSRRLAARREAKRKEREEAVETK